MGEGQSSASLRTRLVLPLSLLVSVMAVGALGYHWLWSAIGGTWLDAVFMTFTTITTIGYGEVKPLDGFGRVFTMAIALAGIGAFFYTFSVVLDHLVASGVTGIRGRRRMERRISELAGHVIVAGLGRVGRQAATELAEAGTPFVALDPGPAAARFAEERGYVHLSGDATEDSVLERAGVRRARGLIATTANDATNMYIVLSARVLNPGLRIVARAADESSVPKLLRAGADRAISPYAIGGHRLAHLILSRPSSTSSRPPYAAAMRPWRSRTSRCRRRAVRLAGRSRRSRCARPPARPCSRSSARARPFPTRRQTSRSRQGTACSRWGPATSSSGSRS